MYEIWWVGTLTTGCPLSQVWSPATPCCLHFHKAHHLMMQLVQRWPHLLDGPQLELQVSQLLWLSVLSNINRLCVRAASTPPSRKGMVSKGRHCADTWSCKAVLGSVCPLELLRAHAAEEGQDKVMAQLLDLRVERLLSIEEGLHGDALHPLVGLATHRPCHVATPKLSMQMMLCTVLPMCFNQVCVHWGCGSHITCRCKAMP